MTSPSRIAACFDRLKAESRSGFVAYIMGGDPDIATCRKLLLGLPDAGADIVELGFPFTDPTADGPTIQAAGTRALKAGTTLDDVLDLAKEFRAAHPETPLVLMGYANPIHRRGWAAFSQKAAEAGVDGVIVVDLPPEEDSELRQVLSANGLSVIRLAAPTSDSNRLDTIVENATGFIYYVSVTGVTGAGSSAESAVAEGLARVRQKSTLPVVAGFGVRTPEQSEAVARHADAVVVGSAIVDALAGGGPDAALEVTQRLAAAAHNARDRGAR
ncbi:MAG: tryptophan synthase subunit alpha [Maricaulaceae bacterium]